MNGDDWKSRTDLLLGKRKSNLLHQAHVLIAGLGGVGSYAAEQLCRAGIGELTLVDIDTIQPSNRNRQIIALRSTQGKLKTEVIAGRLKDINPEIELHVLPIYLNEESIPKLLSESYDVIIDAIDTLTPKVLLLKTAVESGLRVISSMGSGGKTDPLKITIDDISNSHHCKFAYIVRKYLHRFGISEGITVVYSSEPVRKEAIVKIDDTNNRRSIVGTISYIPAIFGCYCAAEAIRRIISAPG